jgi:hypothetical protein
MARHRLDADGRTLHGTFSPDRAPVLTVAPAAPNGTDADPPRIRRGCREMWWSG